MEKKNQVSPFYYPGPIFEDRKILAQVSASKKKNHAQPKGKIQCLKKLPTPLLKKLIVHP